MEIAAPAPIVPIAEFNSYAALLAALRKAREHRGVSMEALDELGFMPKGLASKVLGPNPQRGLTTQTLPYFLVGLGVKCLLVEDPETMPENVKRAQLEMMRLTQTHYVMTNGRWQKISSKGRAARWKGVSKKKRKTIMRRVARARWARRDASIMDAGARA